MQNFADVVSLFLEKEAVVQVKDALELETRLVHLLTDAARREQLGRNGQAVVRQNLGAIERTVEMILHGINDERRALQAEMQDVGVVNFLIRHTGTIPVDRSAGAGAYAY